MPLILSRKVGEEIVVNGPCVIQVADVSGKRVRLAFTAPSTTRIDRRESLDAHGPAAPKPPAEEPPCSNA